MAAVRTDLPHRTVRWPAGTHDAWPWFDPCWSTLPGASEHLPLWEAHAHYRRTGDRTPFEEEARRRQLTEHLFRDRNRPDWGLPSVSLDDLVRLTTDTWPAAGMDAPDIVLGPRSVFASPLLQRVAIAGCAFVWSDDWPQSCFHIWCRGKPLPSPELRARFRAVGLAPWALWRVERSTDGLLLHDYTGLVSAYHPTGPVEVVGEPPTGEGLAARVFLSDRGWVAHCALDVPTLPTPEVVHRWLEDETWMARTVQPGITREALLRKRPGLVCISQGG